MMEFAWIEAATHWLVTYAAHSCALAIIGLAVALAFFRPGARRASVLKVALVGGLVSASLPWKAIEPVSLLPDPAPVLFASTLEGADDGALASASGTGVEASPPALDVGAYPNGLDTAPLRRPLSALASIVAVLAALAIAGVLRLLSSRRAFIRALRAEPLNDPASSALVNAWAKADTRPSVALSSSASLRCPVVISSKEICVPEGLWSVLSTSDKEAALAHEFAHIERCDPFWFMATAALSRALFFLPWHGVLRRRWVQAAEFACDRRAATRIGSDTRIALCLSSVAEWSAKSPGGREGVPASMAAMAARPGELVHRVQDVLQTEGAPSTGRFRFACVAALAAFACAAPELSSSQEEPPPVSGIMIQLSADRMVTLERSDGAPEHEPLTVRFQGKQAKVDVGNWFANAVADFPMSAWPGTTTMARSGTVLIRTGPETPFRDIQRLMAQCGDMRVQMPDVRIDLDGVIYPVPLPVDIGVPKSADSTILQGVRTDFRLDRDAQASGSIRYSVMDGEATLPGTIAVPVEEEEVDEDAFFIGKNALPRRLPTLESLAFWIDEKHEAERVIQATIDPRIGVTAGEVAALLDVLIKRDITDITFKGSFEQ